MAVYWAGRQPLPVHAIQLILELHRSEYHHISNEPQASASPESLRDHLLTYHDRNGMVYVEYNEAMIEKAKTAGVTFRAIELGDFGRGEPEVISIMEFAPGQRQRFIWERPDPSS